MGSVAALSNGNYVVYSSHWNQDRGAVTWGEGLTGVVGEVSAENSLTGAPGDRVGFGGIYPLPNGNYVVLTSSFDNGSLVDVGAVTWGDGTLPISGTISATNSIVGSSASDRVGSKGIRIFPNGNYVVISPEWHNGTSANAGAITWASGSGPTGLLVSEANSLVGSSAGDSIGYVGDVGIDNGIDFLSNGNYVVRSPKWDNGSNADVGAVTWGNGTSGVSGEITSLNSLIGEHAGDQLGSTNVTPLPSGNYLVLSPLWDNDDQADAGAVTWADGNLGLGARQSHLNSR